MFDVTERVLTGLYLLESDNVNADNCRQDILILAT